MGFWHFDLLVGPLFSGPSPGCRPQWRCLGHIERRPFTSTLLLPHYFLKPFPRNRLLGSTSRRRMMAFDNLPPELSMTILELLESTTDLYSVISASPNALRVFEASSERVLLTVTQRRMNPQSLRHAIATIGIPSVRRNRPESLRFKPLWKFLDRYFSSDPEASIDIRLGPGNARALATIHAHVRRHIRRYADQTCVQLSGPKHGTGLDETRQHTADSGQRLSSTELIRLERGFYRYELYCRVFPAEPGNALQSRSSAIEQFEHFIKHLKPWEVEEIVCVHEYFVYHLGTIVDDLESQLVTRFLANASQESPGSDAQQSAYYGDLNMRKMTLFSTQFRKSSLHNLGYIAACGLNFMDNVFHAATSAERLDLLRSHGPGWRDLLADALYRGARETPHSPISRDFKRDDPSLPNLGYLKYAPDVTTIYLQILEEDLDLLPIRLLGYVFWDSDRLEKPRARSILEQGQDMPTTELHRRFDRSKQPSAEARLDGFRVRQEVMDDLVQDYSSTLEFFSSSDELEEVEDSGHTRHGPCESDASDDSES